MDQQAQGNPSPSERAGIKLLDHSHPAEKQFPQLPYNKRNGVG